MSQDYSEFMRELLADFQVEAAEHRQHIVDALIELESSSDAGRDALLEAMLREAHSLKGASRAVDAKALEQLCQSMESVLAALKSGKLPFEPDLLDLLHSAVDTLDEGLAAVADGRTDHWPEHHAAVVARLEAVRRCDPSATARQVSVAHQNPAARPTPTEPAELSQPEAELSQPEAELAEPPTHTEAPQPAAEHEAAAPARAKETVRTTMAKLSAILREAEELLSAKSMLSHHLDELKTIAARQSSSRRDWEHLRSEFGRDSELLEALDPWQADHFRALREDLGQLAQRMEHDQRLLARMVDDLLVDLKRALLFPCGSLLAGLPKLVRDLARDRGKQVAFEFRGAEVEIDRRVLEEIKDPLIHLLRNAVDHGLEAPAERQRASKPPIGALSLTITQAERGQVRVQVADDGVGLDSAQLKAAASRSGILPAAQVAAMSAEESWQLAFGSGVSTSPLVTDISGRGLGLAIVAEKVTRLGGTIAVRSAPGAGTTFDLVLPQTMVTFRGVLVRVGEQLLFVPVGSIELATRVAAADIRTVEGQPTVLLGGQVTPLARLADVLGIPGRAAAAETMPALVLAAGPQRVALAVDEVLREEEALLRELGPQLRSVRRYAGASVLGSGQVVPVLEPAELIEASLGRSAEALPTAAEEVTEAPKAVLVAEDSLTSRTLLRTILDAAGYLVTTAVDGVDAARALREGNFDLLVTDVEMPRMDGFDLTSLVRADKRLADLPVVLVTAREAPEDRERGLAVGANAYIIKSSFEQSNLLEAVRRLIG